ncbi:MAG: tRNA adenosine deaminase-associated protein [Motilibacteraceae bacterium]
MAYFTAVLARDGAGWEACDVEAEETDDLGELAGRLRGAAVDDGTVLLVLEREDSWFAIVRVDGEDDPRVFVSDLESALASPYAEALGLEELEAVGALAADLDGPRPVASSSAVTSGAPGYEEDVEDISEELDEGEEGLAEATGHEDDEESGAATAPSPAAGDLDLLADLGVAPEQLLALTGDDAPTTGEAVGAIAEAAGFADLVDALR